MALQILENRGVFYVNGKINSTTTRNFIIHFDYMLDSIENVMINIDGVEAIDLDGFSAMNTLMQIAKRNNKTFSIVGKGCRQVYQDFKCYEVA